MLEIHADYHIQIINRGKRNVQAVGTIFFRDYFF
jgi:hypothetical protein